MYKVDIDFDEASRVWRQNKIHIGHGSFRYICGYMTQKGENCKNKPSCRNGRCHIHKKNAYKIYSEME